MIAQKQVLQRNHIIAAAHEKKRRLAARETLLGFARYVMPGFITGKHHKVLTEKLEAVERGELKRLIINMPPRHGKSLLASQLFPCWVLGRNPTYEIAMTSYGASLAESQSRRARDFFVSHQFTKLFPQVRHAPGKESQTKVPVERQAAKEWGTKQRGHYYAVGVGGGLTGRGADIAIIDDPLKDREEANSPRRREAVRDWYRSTLRTRLAPGGAIILIMTRWHTEDLAGTLLDEMQEDDGEQWEVLKFQAIDENGGFLWPDRFTPAEYNAIQVTLGTYEWGSLYQQEPIRRGGNMFHLENVAYHSHGEFPDIKYVRFWDLASSIKQRATDDPDLTAGALVGVTSRKQEGSTIPIVDIWIKDVVFGQWEAPERQKKQRQVAEEDGRAVEIVVESVAGYKDAYTTMKSEMAGFRVVKPFTSSKDKVVRATPLEALFEYGRVHVARAKWNDLFIKHFEEFPVGTHDDIVDAVSGAFNYLIKPNGLFIV